MAARNPFSNIIGNRVDSETDLTQATELGPFRFREKIMPSTYRKIACIYIEGHLFQNLTGWQDSNQGKDMLNFLRLPRYSNHLKCIFFDNITLVGETLPNCVRNNVMESMINWTHDINQIENINCFSICSMCNRFCTVNFNYENIPKLHCQIMSCVECIARYNEDL